MHAYPRHIVSSRAFTLIEVTVVIIVMALLATAAALSFARPLRSARASEAIELVRTFDGNARTAARRFGSEIEMRFDLSRKELVRRVIRDDGRRRSEDISRSRLPGGCRVDRMILAGGETRDTGEVVIHCSSGGLSRSYGVHVIGNGPDRWLVVAGLSGQISEAKNETELRSILESATPGRNDAR
jgi:prepilin-type N-terminal cleavage/methylation domain-containing protein